MPTYLTNDLGSAHVSLLAHKLTASTIVHDDITRRRVGSRENKVGVFGSWRLTSAGIRGWLASEM